MAFFRSAASVGATTAIAAASAIPAAISLSSSSSPSSPQTPQSQSLRFPSSIQQSVISSPPFGLVRSLTNPPSAVQMDSPASVRRPPVSQDAAATPELLTEFMVDMKCEGCVKAVKNKLQTVEGIMNVEVDLSNQVVRILGSSSVRRMSEALEQTGRKVRLIGQGVPEDFLVSAAVAEFKGPDIFGVVRFAQVSMELSTIEANFSGLSPGRHGWSINAFGDLTRGAASTGKIFDPVKDGITGKPLGDLGTLEVDSQGNSFFSGTKQKVRVLDLIGRAVVVYNTEDKSDQGLAAAVIARSAGVGENYKKICSCDGTTIWEATNSDFVTSKV